MPFTKLQGARPETIGAIVRGFDAQDWCDVDAFLDEHSHLSYVEQFDLLGPVRTDPGEVEHAQSAENVIEGLRARNLH